MKAAPVDHATIVVFTGVWQERPADPERQAKRTRRGSGKRSKKSDGKLDVPRNYSNINPAASVGRCGHKWLPNEESKI
ncbi:MAG: hypothetical protein ACLPKT_03190 [Methylocella sp.]